MPAKWSTPTDYAGFDPVGDYVITAQTRDSNALDRSNFIAARLRLLEAAGQDKSGEDTSPVYEWRAGHWACGWVEYLMLRADAPEGVLREAEAIERELREYPALDEDLWANMEYDEANAYWASLTVRDRAEMIRDYAPEVSLFAARREWVPSNDGMLDEVLRS